ncbi:MAG: class I SAM-dependent methyltransferase [Deltaproteobacteria bacterium]|nr:class I SAM-dependent methyltransferase [Deltaproteobacteria bacterium]MBT7203000.1 class I SAM-dependent methyltransferase [Deltaproteobacteria bacterium]
MIPEQLFTKEDSNDDNIFYTSPRLVKHIDENACQVLKNYYNQLLKDGDAVLDLMSSWVSHLPDHKHYSRVSGHGMNQIELQNNVQLTDFHIQNLNTEQQLPYGDEEFDLCMIAVSVQYLTSPVQVFKEIYRVLRPNGTCCVSFSNRMFPTKAILAWRMFTGEDQCRLVSWYFERTGEFREIQSEQLVSENSNFDPLYVVTAKKILV